MLYVAVPPNPKICICSIIHKTKASKKKDKNKVYIASNNLIQIIVFKISKYSDTIIFLPIGGNNPNSHRIGIRLNTMYEILIT